MSDDEETAGPHWVPGDLDTHAQALYRKLRDHLRESEWRDSDHYLLTEACRADQRARAARAEMTDGESGKVRLTTKGSTGNLVQHPNLKTAREAEQDFISALKELGLTPAARRRLDIKPAPPDVSKFGLRAVS